MQNDSEQKDLYLKIHKSDKEVLIAVCDCDLMGKRFTENRLHVEINREFFGDMKASDLDMEIALKGATIANFVGRRCVQCAIELGYVDEKNVLIIDGVFCAQMVRM
jgi:uncharacterized protein